jgi:hypothetical protein
MLNIVDKLFLEIGKGFTIETYLMTTKVQGILWSISDVIIIYAILRIISIIRNKNHKKRIFYRYILLWLSVILVPFLVLTGTSKSFFILESVIFGLQFTVLIYSLFVDTKDAMEFFRNVRHIL